MKDVWKIREIRKEREELIQKLSTLDKSVVLIILEPKDFSSNTVNDPGYSISKLAVADHISKHKEYGPRGAIAIPLLPTNMSHCKSQ